MAEWITNWPINWVGNSVANKGDRLPVPAQHATVRVELSTPLLTHRAYQDARFSMTHEYSGGPLVVTGRLYLCRHGSWQYYE